MIFVSVLKKACWPGEALWAEIPQGVVPHLIAKTRDIHLHDPLNRITGRLEEAHPKALVVPDNVFLEVHLG